MSQFPLAAWPQVTWHSNPRNTHFGAPRGGRFPVHGACDLIVPAGTKVLAVQDGVVIRTYPFVTYSCNESGKHKTTTTWAIDVAHNNFTARYGEVSCVIPVSAGSTISEGQVIAEVGIQCGGSMLHFELFDSPDRRDYLTDSDTPGKRYLYVPPAHYERRNDLLDPTFLLDRWYSELPALLDDQ